MVTADSGADQPTLRDQLVETLTGRWLSYGDDKGDDDLTEHEDRDGARITPTHARLLAEALLPVIEADRERAQAEAVADALKGWARAFRIVSDFTGRRRERPMYAAAAQALEDDVEERRAAVAGGTG